MWFADHTRRRRLLLAWGVIFMAGALVWTRFAAGQDSIRAWRALLASFLFFVSLGAGLAVWPAIASTCNGRWHRGIQHLTECGASFGIPSLLVLGLLWVGSSAWSPWFGVEHHQGTWLGNGCIFGRDIIALGLFWWLVRHHRSGRAGGWTAGLLVAVYCLVFSLLGFDLVMALDPHWYSTLAGGYFFISGLYIAITGWALLAALSPVSNRDERHDLGRLVLCFSLMTTYLMYSHLLPVWYENLPHEVRFPLRRMISPVREISILLLVLVYLGPLAMLLTERAKRSRLCLGSISAVILLGMWTERWWLVVPTFDPTGRFGGVELSAGAALAGLFGLAATVGGTSAPVSDSSSGRGE